MPLDTPKSFLEITLHGEHAYSPLLLDVADFLEDFTLLYEFARLGIDPRYPLHPASLQYSRNRNSRPLTSEDRLHVTRINHESPLLITATVLLVSSAVAAVWSAVQAYEKIRNLKINREILELSRKKLIKELEDCQMAPVVIPSSESFRHQLSVRDLDYFFDRTVDRLEMSSVRIREIEITLIPNAQARSSTASAV